MFLGSEKLISALKNSNSNSFGMFLLCFEFDSALRNSNSNSRVRVSGVCVLSVGFTVIENTKYSYRSSSIPTELQVFL